MDMDLAYANGAFIADAASYPAKWTAAAASFRSELLAEGRARLDLPYGNAAREKMDIFQPTSAPQGLMVFIHGGYWHKFDKSSWSHFAAGALARGWAVAMPSYTLAPEARISDITGQMVQAITLAAGEIAGPIVLTGHSAGGHLSARMLCPDVALPAEVVGRIQKVVPISPLSDLHPLRQTEMNEILGLTEAEAQAESPQFCATPHPVSVTVWVGSDERPAFLDQARWLTDAWENAGLHIAPEKHHFDVIDELLDAESPLMEVLLGFV